MKGRLGLRQTLKKRLIWDALCCFLRRVLQQVKGRVLSVRQVLPECHGLRQRRGEGDPAALTSLGVRAHDDFNVLIERRQEAHQALGCVAA